MDLSVVITLLSMLLGMLVVVYIIAADKTRYLIRFDLALWRDRYYLSALPNFLQSLYDNHFRSPWPRRCNAVSEKLARIRFYAIIQKRPSLIKRRFLDHHFMLRGLLETLRPFISDFVLSEQLRIVGNCLIGMEDTSDRDRLAAFLEVSRHRRAAFHKSLTPHDHAQLAEIIDRRFIPTLRSANAIFQEHGFSLLPEFDMLRQWESLTGSELVQEIPDCRNWASPAAIEPASTPLTDSAAPLADDEERTDNG